MIKFFFPLIFSWMSLFSFAGEGMWIPLLLENRTIADMQAAGLKLSAADIYSINQACLKDAVVMFGKNCTGELISPEGLLITNHHCGYGRIQAHSTVEKDYLTDGFWAQSRSEELPNPGLTVSFLVRMEDVTEKALLGVTPDMPEGQREEIVNKNSREIIAKAVKDTHYEAGIESFFFGSDYYLFVYEVFEDVRLVGAPPSAIGKFGGDTDNWIWPRHTGDFCLFRVYAGKDNKPAPYDTANIPYRPKKYLTISAQGVHEGDFTMVIGYPANTDEYLYSGGLELITREILPVKVKMREERLGIMQEEMAKSPAVKLQYAEKYQGTANAWKKWIGVIEGVQRTKAIYEKRKQESMFTDTALTDTCRTKYFKPVLLRLHDFYSANGIGIAASELGHEALNSFEMASFASNFDNKVMMAGHDTGDLPVVKDQLRKMTDGFFKKVDLTIDRRTMESILGIYFASVDPLYFPGIYNTIRDRFDGDANGYVEWLFHKSIFTHQEKLNRSIDNLSARSVKKILSDPASLFYRSFAEALTSYYPVADSLNLVLQRLYRDYLRGLMATDTNRVYYPDANFTMRVTFGKVEGYKAADAVTYDYHTTATGILEKENPEIDDYKVDEKLRQILEKKDFGRYGQNATLPVCFIASNHTSGGNSGSPVLDKEGRLIGINFDRNWEGTVSDFEYDPAVCRNISLDIRYVLFLIDKYAGASNIMQELTIE
jgi:Peptidase S46